jgi:hypothetical protein
MHLGFCVTGSLFTRTSLQKRMQSQTRETGETDSAAVVIWGTQNTWCSPWASSTPQTGNKVAPGLNSYRKKPSVLSFIWLEFIIIQPKMFSEDIQFGLVLYLNMYVFILCTCNIICIYIYRVCKYVHSTYISCTPKHTCFNNTYVRIYTYVVVCYI